ncbi:hypothetical protein AArcSl_1628 [Halalkaliarchaeum desulfuricum]|uniref:Uncharacterized protein n=1 Tax=Halalkaliarchaeum desulfuricum TaxID=2055893 RepID=A0A343TJI5_9EURY|nr:hypothetical protein [Halalkaliarchaeum desulfuricum]AUX09257.1 hypothetical protein AArcSl_1628 [Halalkaliarchaeum desulfuricum]
MSEYDHNELVRLVYQNLEEDLDQAELVACKDGKEIKLGNLNVQRRHWDGKEGAPDIVVQLRGLSLLGRRFDTIPFALVEIEESIGAAKRDLESFLDKKEDNKPTVIVTDGESESRRLDREGTHVFDIEGISHTDIDE